MSRDAQSDNPVEVEGSTLSGPGVSRLLGSMRGAPTPDQTGVQAMIRAAVFPSAAAPPRIGRFVIERLLGAGGMGVVYLAHDETLDRKVAVKLVTGASRHASLRARLRREAKIMAQLNHPNVVGVHEFGEHEGRFFVAMEFVEGRTLARWLLDEAPPQRAILDVFVQAGRGLAAAHARGIVHRDFKPSNVLVGDDGRVRVADFGLARNEIADRIEVDADAVTVDAGGRPSFGLTSESARSRTGQRLGTPAYMSPEQFRGQAVDARSDQFSFCVALSEALFGERPFPATSITALEEAFEADAPLAPSARRKVPRWLADAIARGLALDPTDRWPSMNGLVERLSRDPVRRRRRVGASILALAAVGALGYFAAADPTPPVVAEVCGGVEEHLTGVWDGARRAELEQTLADSEVAFARDLGPLVRPGLDAYRIEWIESYGERCRGHARGEYSDTLHDQAMRCLADSRTALEASVNLLVDGEPSTLHNAVAIVADLPAISRCSELDALGASFRTPDDAADFDEAGRLNERLIQLDVAFAAGHVDHVTAGVDEVGPAVEALHFPPVDYAYWHLRGQVEGARSRWPEAIEAYRRALDAALAAGDDQEAMWTAVIIATDSAAVPRPDSELFESHARLARSLAVRVGEVAAVEVALNVARSRVLEREDLVEAVAVVDDAVEDARALDDEHWKVRLAALVALGSMASRLGRVERASSALVEVRDLRDRHFGPWHPQQVWALLVLGRLQVRTDPAAALETLERGEQLVRALQGESSPLCDFLREQAVAHERLGSFERALGALGEAIDVAEQIPSYELEHRAALHNSVGVVLVRMGRHAEARDELTRVLEDILPVLGAGHPLVGVVRMSLADALLALGDTERARHEYRQGAEIWAALDPGGMYATYAQNGLALVDLAEGRRALARVGLEDVLVQREAGDVPAEEIGSTRFALARVLGRDGDRARARELAQLALADYRRAGPGYDRERTAVADWLRDHPVVDP